ncbi:hypothetical protein EVG20_g6011 [Dentipellis fragilis]|uniref:Glyoxal oxidase N-terminal domain-containing protein n=1 Tax=Dentipellis fragilis TaxID=205917 RepID=A0A4Y9YQ05_9AGAM|nr:hypothetical protein EVG20_g6011 [Dentipellis fragilis]
MFDFTPRNMHAAVASALCAAATGVLAQSSVPSPGQPSQTGAVGTFQIVGNSVVSAQQLFVGTSDKVYVVDKTENNPASVGGHPAWAAEYALSSNNGRPMDVLTNTFCAGGGVLGNGTWVNAGGNQAVTYGGVTAQSQTAEKPYNDADGGKSLRLLDPCDDGECNWVLAGNLPSRRWYPSLETLEDGSLLIIGGCEWGGFVNDAAQSNPTYEFFPSRGEAITSPMLQDSLPANLYPITFLLPSNRALVQANWKTAILDYNAGSEYKIDDVPDAVRTYPASAGTVMMPMTPSNNWTATVMMCGGSNLQPSQWVTNWDISQHGASDSCVQISPDVSPHWTHVDSLPEGRVMGSLILLPNGRILCLNGAGTGVAGYGNDSWAIGQSYADHPVLSPAIYDPSAPSGSQWSREGLQASTIPRMYHSSATLLPDGSVYVAGSNPNTDYNISPGITYQTEYRVEKFYPSYFSSRRPQPSGLPTQLGYGGAYFNVTLSADDLFHNTDNAKAAKIVVMRFGFSTHAMVPLRLQNMGQRLVELESTYTVNSDGGATIHCSQLPPNPAIMPPGPVLVNDVPSIGVKIMAGSGQLGVQQASAPAALPSSTAPEAFSKSGSGHAQTDGVSNGSSKDKNWTSDAVQPERFRLSGNEMGALLGLVGAVLALLSV